MNALTTNSLCTGTIIRAQGSASEAWYNGVRDAELDRMARRHAEDAARWAEERKRLTAQIASAEREAGRARRTSMAHLRAINTDPGRSPRRRHGVGLWYWLKGTVIVWGLRLRILTLEEDVP